VQCAQSLDLFAKCRVIRIKIGHASAFYFCRVRLCSSRVKRFAIKGNIGAKPRRRLPRVERLAGRVAVEINYCARDLAVNDRYAKVSRKSIKPVNMMIGIPPREIERAQPRNIVGNDRSGMGYANNQRGIAEFDLKSIAHATPGKLASDARLPDTTNACVWAMSG
jgi:hypothetical protein